MLFLLNNNLTGIEFEATNQETDLGNTVAKLSSGKKNLLKGENTGSHSQSTKLSYKNVPHVANVQNLRNFFSFTQSQEGMLQQVSKIFCRTDELTTHTFDISATNTDRENYNKKFLELENQLSKFAKRGIWVISVF